MTGTRKCVSLCWLLLFLILPISIYSQTKNVFESTTTFRCKFPDGIQSDWDSGKLSQEKSTMDDFIISEINRKRKSAVFIGNAGKSPVPAVIGIGVIHFIEITATGNMIVLSIFDKQLSYLHYPAVWSRHMMIGSPIVSQFYGDCKSMD